MYNFCAVCAMGLESVVTRELKSMGMENVAAEDRRVFFTAGASGMARANLCLRAADRVLLILGRFEAKTFDELFERVRALPLESFIGRNDAFPVKGHSLRSVLSSVPACQSIIKKAVVTRLGEAYRIQRFSETGPVKQLQFLLHKDQVTLAMDTSGEGLHKRGYRPAAQDAPIRETLAAGLLSLSGARRFPLFHDPMCGSGTLLIEYALAASDIAPGLCAGRTYAAERYGNILDAQGGMARVFSDERERARAGEKRRTDVAALGWDIDPASVALTLDNAQKAGVADMVRAAVADISVYQPQPDTCMVTNPPYGERLLDVSKAEALYRVIGSRMTSHTGPWGVITPHKGFETLVGVKAAKRRKLYNGKIECHYYMFARERGQ